MDAYTFRTYLSPLKKYNKASCDWRKVGALLAETSVAKLKLYLIDCDWSLVSQRVPLTLSVLRKYKHRLNWNIISSRGDLTDAMINEFEHRLDMKVVSRRQTLSEAMLEAHDSVDWAFVSRHYRIRPAWASASLNGRIDWDVVTTQRQLESVPPSVRPFIDMRKYLRRTDLSARNKADFFQANRLSVQLLIDVADHIDWLEFTRHIFSYRDDILLPLKDRIVWENVKFDKSYTTSEHLQKLKLYLNRKSVKRQLGGDLYNRLISIDNKS